jgi:hypothetical protein
LLVTPPLSSHVNTSTTSPPQVTCAPVALQTDYVPLRHMLPELERLINAFYSPLLSPLFTRRPRIAYGSSNVHDANDPAPACGIDGLHKFPVLPLATPTRTSLASFEPLLPLLICRFSSPSILLPCCPHRYPALALASSRELSHSGTRSVVCWICRVDGVTFSWLTAQTIFIVAASKRSDSAWFSLGGRGMDSCRDRGDVLVRGGNSSLLWVLSMDWSFVLPLSLCRLVGRTTTLRSLFGDLFH